MKRILLLFTLLTVAVHSQELYKSEAFSITSDKVIQDRFTAEAKSDFEMTSDYKSTFRKKTTNLIYLKFSINGGDNEAFPGSDHHLFLDPANGKQTSPVYEFGKPHSSDNDKHEPGFLTDDMELILRVDMKRVLSDFRQKGYFQTYNGDKIQASDFKGVYAAGNTFPLTWNFNSLNSLTELSDKDGDGIYEAVIDFKKEFSPLEDQVQPHWKLLKDLSSFPSYKSPFTITNAIYNKALEELLLDFRDDGAFMAGEKWPGVWTRDISYSILLSLGIVAPDASKTSLKAKVKNDRIIQDTGTGGAWPVSSDRMTWALAAWEVYKVTGDHEWLKYIYKVIKNSAEDDLQTVYDKQTGLFNGESSFLDWREQTYPAWMDPKDIYVSKNLGTNAVHYQTYKILSEISRLLNEPYDKYEKAAEGIKDGMNKYLWIENKGYFGQYLYGRNYLTLSPRSESLGESLSVLFNIAEKDRAARVISCTPVTRYGTPCIYPQIPKIPPYHNDAVWPFVETFRGWASAKQKNDAAVEHSLAGIYRAAALFGTNKENFVATTGDYIGTEINSSRQLWSVAGNLATVYRILFGLNFGSDSLSFSPFIPERYQGERELKNLKYRDAVLTIKINGFGSKIKSFSLDGKISKKSVIPGNMKGEHAIEIVMNNELNNSESINLVSNAYSPEIPAVQINSKMISWNKVPSSVEYDVYKNGSYYQTTRDTTLGIDSSAEFAQYQVLSRNNDKRESFLSTPVSDLRPAIISEAENQNSTIESKETGFSGTGYMKIDKKDTCHFKVEIPQDGEYLVDFRYANGNGPINTSNKCAVRDLLLNDQRIGAVILPQRGDGIWNEWGYSNSLRLKLNRGEHQFKLLFTGSDNNMNVDVNTAFIDHMRLIKVK